VGKSTTAAALAEQAALEYLNVGQLAKEEGLHDGWDEEYECHVLDEDRLLDEMEERLVDGGVVVDYHSCELFPERWFDLVIVLTAETNVLYERLTSRNYSAKKLAANMECEIFRVLLEEARESYREDIVQALPSNTVEEMEANVATIGKWVEEWKPAR
jgi:adenylate kinase